MVAKERDDELMLFVEMREKENAYKIWPLQNSHVSLGSNNVGVFSRLSDFVSAPPSRETAFHSFLSSQNNVSDYDWLVAPPGAPPPPSMDKESLMNKITVPNSRPTALKPWLINIIEEPASKSRLVPENKTSLSRQNPSHARSERPSSMGGPKSSSAPAKLTSMSTLPGALNSARSSADNAPTLRGALRSTARTSTPTVLTTRSSTPNSRSTALISKSTPMSATPSIQPVSPSASTDILSSSSIEGGGPSSVSCPVPAQGLPPAVKPEMPGFSFDSPPNLLTSLPKWANSESRTRPGAQIVRSSAVQLGRNGRLKRQTCSPSRTRLSTSNSYNFRSSSRCMLETDANSRDSETPKLIGIKMVQGVVNMRKLASWKQDDKCSGLNNHPEKMSPSINGPGFGRTLSKTSVEMAMKHMDIRQNMSLDLHASVAYCGRFGPKTGRTWK